MTNKKKHFLTERTRHWMASFDFACQVTWGLEQALAAEKCAQMKAQVATKCE